jgi:hypothetical protein
VPLTPVETTVSATAIRVRYADHADASKATEWIDVQVKLSDLKLLSGTKITNPDTHPLAGLRLTALLHAREVANAEIQRLAEIVRRTQSGYQPM